MDQEGSYVDIPGNSKVYLYYNGDSIGGWSKEQFCAVLWDYVDENVDIPDDTEKQTLHNKFTDYFDGIDREYNGGVPDPECAEIVAQCIDSRFEGVELTEDMQTALQDSFTADEWLFDCQYCGTEFRPYFRSGEPYTCQNDECSEKQDAEILGLTIHELREYNQLLDAEIMNNHINEDAAKNYFEEKTDD